MDPKLPQRWEACGQQRLNSRQSRTGQDELDVPPPPRLPNEHQKNLLRKVAWDMSRWNVSESDRKRVVSGSFQPYLDCVQQPRSCSTSRLGRKARGRVIDDFDLERGPQPRGRHDQRSPGAAYPSNDQRWFVIADEEVGEWFKTASEDLCMELHRQSVERRKIGLIRAPNQQYIRSRDVEAMTPTIFNSPFRLSTTDL